MALTTESHTLRVRTGVFPIAQSGTGDLPQPSARKALRKTLTSSASAKPGRRAKTGLNRDSKHELKVSTTEF